MGYNRNQAKALLNDAEYELFLASLPERVGDLDQRELRSAVTRTRRARDKQRDLFQRQSGATSARARARGAALGSNERTQQKAKIFTETLTRLETETARRERAEARAARQAALERANAARGATPNRATRRAATTKTKRPSQTGFVTAGAKAAHNRATVTGPTHKSISASRQAAGKRAQARRDRRS